MLEALSPSHSLFVFSNLRDSSLSSPEIRGTFFALCTLASHSSLLHLPFEKTNPILAATGECFSPSSRRPVSPPSAGFLLPLIRGNKYRPDDAPHGLKRAFTFHDRATSPPQGPRRHLTRLGRARPSVAPSTRARRRRMTRRHFWALLMPSSNHRHSACRSHRPSTYRSHRPPFNRSQPGNNGAPVASTYLLRPALLPPEFDSGCAATS